MAHNKIVEFAKQHGYDDVVKLENWRGFEVYEPVFSGDDVAIVGLPLLILVKNKKIRMSTDEEALQHIDETA